MRSFAAALLVVVCMAPAHAAGAESPAGSMTEPVVDRGPTPWLAFYDGTVIDLRDGWGTATACSSDGVVTVCFDSEAEMDRATDDLVADVVETLIGVISPLSACGSTLRLYNTTGFGGSVLQLTQQGVFVDLSTYSFNNITSSYRVGACSSVFADGSGGSGAIYPGNTSAGVQASSMVAGWNDRISSIYIF
jgi:hypothetical protein